MSYRKSGLVIGKNRRDSIIVNLLLLPEASTTASSSRKASEASPGPSESTSMFSLSIEGYKATLSVEGVVMYSVWPFFRRLIDSGMSESHTRHVSLPSDFPPDLLVRIVQALYGVVKQPSAPPSKLESQYAVENGLLYGLVESDGTTPAPLFRPLMRVYTRIAAGTQISM